MVRTLYSWNDPVLDVDVHGEGHDHGWEGSAAETGLKKLTVKSWLLSMLQTAGRVESSSEEGYRYESWSLGEVEILGAMAVTCGKIMSSTYTTPCLCVKANQNTFFKHCFPRGAFADQIPSFITPNPVSLLSSLTDSSESLWHFKHAFM